MRLRLLAPTLALSTILLAACGDDATSDTAADARSTTTGGDSAPSTTTMAPAPERCDWAFNTVGYYAEADEAGMPGGVPPSGGEPMGDLDHGDMDHSADGDMDHGDMDHGEMPMATATTMAGAGEGAHGGHSGHGNEDGPQPWTPLTDPADCEQLADELDLARETAAKYPTAADAEAVGYTRVAPYIPGIAAHWINRAYVADGVFDIAKPEMLLYDGNGPTASIVGLSYRSVSKTAPDAATLGFVGANDGYHSHPGLCVSAAKGVVGPPGLTDEECAARGGVKADGTGYMQHTWVVPGCESPWGVFSGQNPKLDWDLGMQSGKPGSTGCTHTAFTSDDTPGAPPAD